MSVEVFNRTAYPYSAAVLLGITWADGTHSSGTGAVVGRNDVLTATHVLYDPDRGGWATQINIYPGADYNNVTDRFESTPYSLGTYRWIASAWPTGTFVNSDNETVSYSETQYDIGVIGLSVAIGDRVGWFGLANGFDNPEWAFSIGYPENSTGMMLATTWVTHESWYEVYTSTADNGGDLMGRGSSGGPLFVYSTDGQGPYIIGVKSSGGPAANHWADIGFLYDQIIEAISANDYLLGAAANTAPRLAAPIPDLTATIGRVFNYRLAAGTFVDTDLADTITYRAMLDNGSALPSWLTFASGTQTFSGTPPVGSSGTIAIRVTASDTANATASDVFSLRLVDTTPPMVSTFSPADEATGIAVDSNIVLTFSETIARGTGTIVLKTSTGTVIETYNAATSSNLSIAGSTLTINPTADLANSTAYKAEFAAGTIKDLADNSYAGTTSYNFTTVAYVNHSPTGSVTISGTPVQRQTLTASNTLADVDGLGTISYQWKAGGSNITGATASTLVLTEAQVGKTIAVTATYTDGHGTAENVSSSATTTVANVNDLPTGVVTISGTTTEGQTLSAVNTLADADGLGTITYQWQMGIGSSWSTIGSSNTLTLAETQVGKEVRVLANYVDGHGTNESVTSTNTAAVLGYKTGTAAGDVLVGTAYADTLLGLAGTDTITGSGGNDTIDGGTGTDIAVYSGNRSDYSIAKSTDGSYTVNDLRVLNQAGGDGSDVLSNVERLQFADWSLAFDLDGNAGTAAKILGLVFGKESPANKSYVGIGLNLLDGGMSYADLMQAALNVKLGNGFSNAAEITLLYQNLIGAAPGQSDLAYWDGVLASGQYTQASLAVMAADTTFNATNINLVGLTQTGIEFL